MEGLDELRCKDLWICILNEFLCLKMAKILTFELNGTLFEKTDLNTSCISEHKLFQPFCVFLYYSFTDLQDNLLHMGNS